MNRSDVCPWYPLSPYKHTKDINIRQMKTPLANLFGKIVWILSLTNYLKGSLK